MLVRLLEDLRFVIGLFFGIIGTILVLTPSLGGATLSDVKDINLDYWTGGVMLVFSVLMIFGAVRSANRK